jgi:hypothetical protein
VGVRIRRDPDGVVHSGPSCSRRVAVTAAVKTCALFGEGFEGRELAAYLGSGGVSLAYLRGGRVVEQDEQTVEHDPFNYGLRTPCPRSRSRMTSCRCMPTSVTLTTSVGELLRTVEDGGE